jgi:integrase
MQRSKVLMAASRTEDFQGQRTAGFVVVDALRQPPRRQERPTVRPRGSLLPRQNKNGTTTWYIKYSVEGRPVKKAIGPSRREAQRALIAALAAVDQGALRAPSREKFCDAADRWLARKRPRVERSTYRGYEIEIRTRLKPTFGHLKLQQITRERIERYLADLDQQGKLSRKTINDSLIPLRQILDRAVRDGVMAQNPAASSREERLKLPYERPTMLYLSRSALPIYLDACSDWYRPLAEVLVGAGLRIGEAIALQWTDVDWDTPALEISRALKDHGLGTPKGDRSRTVYIDPELRGVLQRHHRHQINAGAAARLVFPSPQGKMANRHNVRRRGHDAATRAAGLNPELRLHDLRHTAATLWLAAGVSIYFVQQQMGHKDIQTTIDLYGHPDQEAHKAAAAQAAAWRRQSATNGPLGTTAGTTGASSRDPNPASQLRTGPCA